MNTSYVRRCCFQALITRKVYNCLIIDPSLLEAVDIRVPAKNFRDLDIIYAPFSRNKYVYVCWVLAANKIYNKVSMFDNHFFNVNLLNNLFNIYLQCSVTFSVITN
jgi:hypothetical protein